jgi:hypothetical protein
VGAGDAAPLDHIAAIWKRSEPDLAALTAPPSQQLIAQAAFTPYPFEDVGAMIRDSNPDLYLFSSDYPHIEGGRDPLGRFTTSLRRLRRRRSTRVLRRQHAPPALRGLTAPLASRTGRSAARLARRGRGDGQLLGGEPLRRAGPASARHSRAMWAWSA